MSTITYSRGSQPLAGAASLKHRVPVTGRRFPLSDIAQWVEHQPDKLRVTGSNPVFEANCL